MICQMNFLKIYFRVPSSEGFGPYRTGRGLHLLFSVFTGGILWVVLNGLHWHYLYSMGLIFVVVLLLWGIGTWLGISSHYNLLIWLLILFVFGITIGIIQRVSWFLFSYWMMLWGGAIGYFAHVFWSIILPKQS